MSSLISFFMPFSPFSGSKKDSSSASKSDQGNSPSSKIKKIQAEKNGILLEASSAPFSSLKNFFAKLFGREDACPKTATMVVTLTKDGEITGKTEKRAFNVRAFINKHRTALGLGPKQDLNTAETPQYTAFIAACKSSNPNDVTQAVGNVVYTTKRNKLIAKEISRPTQTPSSSSQPIGPVWLEASFSDAPSVSSSSPPSERRPSSSTLSSSPPSETVEDIMGDFWKAHEAKKALAALNEQVDGLESDGEESDGDVVYIPELEAPVPPSAPPVVKSKGSSLLSNLFSSKVVDPTENAPSNPFLNQTTKEVKEEGEKTGWFSGKRVTNTDVRDDYFASNRPKFKGIESKKTNFWSW